MKKKLLCTKCGRMFKVAKDDPLNHCPFCADLLIDANIVVPDTERKDVDQIIMAILFILTLVIIFIMTFFGR